MEHLTKVLKPFLFHLVLANLKNALEALAVKAVLLPQKDLGVDPELGDSLHHWSSQGLLKWLPLSEGFRGAVITLRLSSVSRC